MRFCCLVLCLHCILQYMANLVGNSMALSIEVGLCLKTPKCDALDRLLKIVGECVCVVVRLSGNAR